jgi:tetratricopeptide (TPR) repeat protein
VTALALQQLIVQPPGTVPDRLDVMRSLASLLLQEQRYSDAASQFESILAMTKPGSDAQLDQFMLNRAKALRDLTAASANDLIESFNRLSKEQQEEQALHLVDTLLKVQKPELAKEIVGRRKPSAGAGSDADAQWLLALARYHLAMGAKDSALSSLKEIVAKKEVAQTWKGQALAIRAAAELNDNELEKAARDARSAIDTYSKDSGNYVVAGRIAFKQKDYKLAEEFAKKALEPNPYDSAAYMLLGKIKLEGGDVKAAVVNFRKAEELYPSLLEPHRLLSETLPKISADDEAKKESEQLANLEKQQR